MPLGTKRPVFEAALAYLRPDDVLVVWKLDRLGRSLVEMMRTIDALRREKVNFRSLTEQFDSDTAHGGFALQMHGAMAEYFLDLNRERTLEGLKAALARGRKGGRPRKLSEADIEAGRALLAAGTILGGGDRPAPRDRALHLLQLLPASPGEQPARSGVNAMPIRREHRFFYPIDWPQLSAVIRFRRAGGRCEVCARPHGQRVFHLGDGRWWDAEAASWRDGRGRIVCVAVGADDVLGQVRTTRVVLAAAHRDHDTSNNAERNLAAFCQRCHLLHDRPEHRRRRWLTLFRRKALGDLFRGPYSGP